MNFELVKNELFDVVVFAGVLYHLRFPFLGIKRIADAMTAGGLLILETAVLLTKSERPLLFCPAPKDSPYEGTSVSFFNDAGLVATLESFGFTNVECRSVLTPTPNAPRFCSMSGYVSSSYFHENDIGRAVYVASYSPSTDGQTRVQDEYWYSHHKIHSDLHARSIKPVAIAGELARISAQRDQLRAERDALIRSTSWRITRPMGWIRDLLSRPPR